MQYEFLKQFPKRMKNIGLYALLFGNSSQKTTWKQYGFDRMDEQLNVVFAVMLYLMEQSLKKENCLLDDIGAYLDTLNTSSFEKPMSYEDCRRLGDFIVNVVLSNDGRPMYFDGYDFEKREYLHLHISYISNEIVYLDTGVKRTSYRLTEDGYNLLLGTLEVENNMKLTIQEMIFKLHLEKQSYDKAVDAVKNIFQQLQIQLQKIQEAMSKVRRNALNYSVAEYQQILEENMDIVRETRKKFIEYREMVKARAAELEEKHINIQKLDEQEKENLNNLRVIEDYLTRAVDEHQKILNHHLDLKALYTKELEGLSQMSLIQRFSLRTELFDQVLEHPQALDRMELFFRPLFLQAPHKIYNLNKALEPQQTARKKTEADSRERIDVDEQAWLQEQERLRQEKLEKYRCCLGYLLGRLLTAEKFTLAQCRDDAQAQPQIRKKLIPNVEIFKEVMVELIRGGEFDIPALKKERRDFIQENAEGFQINEMLLQLLEEQESLPGAQGRQLCRLRVCRTPDGTAVAFDGVFSADGEEKTIRCSNVLFQAQYE
ncbi:MAG: hypothetical protein HFH33_12560 [Eubacterium sp.]|jgi:hypothetical protein|nr:hypothetical protein [Eubacterium sp.]